jgi:8-hydroxy-5-deazaflavin:NADPH oxidoreductase
MDITLIGATDLFAGGFAEWALGAGHRLTVVGPSLPRAEEYVRHLGDGTPAGPHDPLHDELVFIALPYPCLRDVWEFYGDELDGRTLVDLLTPIDLQTGEPVHPQEGSTAEELAHHGPKARVVKAFNRTFAGRMVSGADSQQAEEVFLAGDEATAKETLAQLFEDGGLHPVDVGPLRRARELGALAYLSAVLRDHPAFNGTPAIKGS